MYLHPDNDNGPFELDEDFSLSLDLQFAEALEALDHNDGFDLFLALADDISESGQPVPHSRYDTTIGYTHVDSVHNPIGLRDGVTESSTAARDT